jgi:hypothetical protein
MAGQIQRRGTLERLKQRRKEIDCKQDYRSSQLTTYLGDFYTKGDSVRKS